MHDKYKLSNNSITSIQKEQIKPMHVEIEAHILRYSCQRGTGRKAKLICEIARPCLFR